MYRARDAVEHEKYLDDLETAGNELDLPQETISTAKDIFLTASPDQERSKRAVLAASLYAGALITGNERSQQTVATTLDVSRLTIQNRWKELVQDAGFEPPTW